MVYLPTLEEWQRNAALLLQARPASVRKSHSYVAANIMPNPTPSRLTAPRAGPHHDEVPHPEPRLEALR